MSVTLLPERAGKIVCQLFSSHLFVLDFRNSRHCGVSHCYSRSKEAVAQALGAIYSRTREAIRENISGKHIDLIQQGNCLRQSLAWQPPLAITRFDIRRNRSRETFRRKSNLIRNRQSLEILHFCQSKKTFRIGKLSHTLFLWFWLFRETNSAHAVMTSSRLSLYIRQNSIDMLHSLTQGHAHTAIGSSCTQSLGVDFSPTTPREAFAHSARRVHARTVKRNAHSGWEGGACSEHSRRQHDHQSYEHQKPHYL